VTSVHRSGGPGDLSACSDYTAACVVPCRATFWGYLTADTLTKLCNKPSLGYAPLNSVLVLPFPPVLGLHLRFGLLREEGQVPLKWSSCRS
jgi:hypothetical protein